MQLIRKPRRPGHRVDYEFSLGNTVAGRARFLEAVFKFSVTLTGSYLCFNWKADVWGVLAIDPEWADEFIAEVGAKFRMDYKSPTDLVRSTLRSRYSTPAEELVAREKKWKNDLPTLPAV